MHYPRHRALRLFLDDVGQHIEQTDDAAEFTLETEVGDFTEFVGQQQQFALSIAVLRQLPRGDFDIARRIVNVLRLKIIEQIKSLAIPERGLHHTGEAEHQRMHPIAAKRRMKSDFEHLQITPITEFSQPPTMRLIENLPQLGLRIRRCTFAPLARIALVKLVRQPAQAGKDVLLMRFGDPVEVGLDQLAWIKTIIIARRWRCCTG